ncbi:Serine/threonine-protein kinase [Tieghemiomyces parasiticus]|uniref:non-specific serine/threonine protein kinase n=1 Tax=Tieghemiomyces parasiticus TaxID=78921 RepID=A0A9W8DTS1_9FUNG|nr:Serine/threonine-protein kinase [Tieghemiomyces parasiticus]
MGQSHSTALSSAASGFTGIGTDGRLLELDGDLHYQKSLGQGQFMKTIRCWHPQEGLVVVKLFVKPDGQLRLRSEVATVHHAHHVLKQLPGVLSYPVARETEHAVYLVRQYLYSNLYDRISTRPFLEPVEKMWITYQLLCALRDVHRLEVCHGDIKAENVLISSWNWAYLSDFAPFKPTFLPEDNPADYAYYFDTSTRRPAPAAGSLESGVESEALRAYVARRGRLTPAMDVFSLGCVIAELYLEGKPVFTLSQLLQFRSGEYDPTEALAAIPDPEVRALIVRMIDRDPDNRPTAAACLGEWQGRWFPPLFEAFLYPYMAGFATFLASLNPPGPPGATDPGRALAARYFAHYGEALDGHRATNAPTTPPTTIVCCSDARIDRVYHDWDLIRSALDLDTVKAPEPSRIAKAAVTTGTRPAALILVDLVTACLRNAAFPTSRRHGLELLYWLAPGLRDAQVLNNVVPHVVSLLGDGTAVVRAMAVHVLTRLLGRMRTVPALDADLFPEYVLPPLRTLAGDPEPVVRLALAAAVAPLAEAALLFLDTPAAPGETDHNADDEASSAPRSFGPEDGRTARLTRLRAQFQTVIAPLLTDPRPDVRRALLVDLARLALFFGRPLTLDFLLSHVVTYLNDRDWLLRGSFCEASVGLAAAIGPAGLEQYLLPLLTQALADPNEGVVDKVLQAFVALAEAGLFPKLVLWDLLGTTLPLVYHPNLAIRYTTVALVAAITAQLPTVDKWCLVLPTLVPYLKSDTLDTSRAALLAALRPPISRRLLQEALAKPSADSGSLDTGEAPGTPEGPRPLYKSATSSGSASPTATAMSMTGGAEPTGRWEYLRHADPQDFAKLDALASYLDKVRRNLGPPRNALASDPANDTSSQRTRPITEAGTDHAVELRDLGLTPHTVFLTPYDAERPVLPTSGTPAEDDVLTPVPLTRSASHGENESPRRQPLERAMGQLALCSQGRSQPVDSADAPHHSPPLSPEASSPPSVGGSQSGDPSAPRLPRHAAAKATATVALSRADSQPGLRRASADSSLDRPALRSLARTLERCGPRSPPLFPHRHRLLRHPRFDDTPTTKYRHVLSGGGGGGYFDAHFPAGGPDVTQVASPTSALHWLIHYDAGQTVKLLLRKKAREVFPRPLPELGPPTDPGLLVYHQRRTQEAIPSLQGWRPEGTLVAYFRDHAATVTAITLTSDQALFATGSHDTTVKVWDATRLSSRVLHRARATYTLGARVTDVTFLRGTHSLAATGDDGTVHLIRADAPAELGHADPDARLVRQTRLTAGEYGLRVVHLTPEAQNYLLVATTACRIVALDVHTLAELWALQLPPRYGLPTALVTDPRHTWLLVGTSRGVLTLWDLRFRVTVKAWQHPAQAPVHQLSLYRTPAAHGRWVFVAAGRGEVSVWDVERAECREVFCGARNWAELRRDLVRHQYQAGEAPTVEVAFAQVLAGGHEPPGSTAAGGNSAAASHVGSDAAVRALVHPPEGQFLLTAGEDRRIKYWDLECITDSYTVSGANPATGNRSRYASHSYGTVTVHTETIASTAPSSVTSATGTSLAGSRSGRSGLLPTAGSPRNAPRTCHDSLRSSFTDHEDCITALQIGEVPFPCVISGARNGAVRIYM